MYFTVFQSPRYHQMTLEEFLFHPDFKPQQVSPTENSNTRTYKFNVVPQKLREQFNTFDLTAYLTNFNRAHESLFAKDRNELFTTFYIEKKGKGMPLVFKKIFGSQARYIECDTGTVCRTIRECLTPLLKQHEEVDHAPLFEAVKAELFFNLAKFGFDCSRIDLEAILSDTYRKIDAPKAELSNALVDLRTIFQEQFRVLYHTSAFAYINRRCVLDSIKRHQNNESKWFCKLDFKNFFGSTTPEFTMKMFSEVYPFSEVVKSQYGHDALKNALSLAFLNGGLPQGTPISPLITNVIMIPIDYKLSNMFRDFNKQRFVYTRYADDILISSRFNFDYHAVENEIVNTLREFDAPFTLNQSKTRYGSSAGSNWNLGLMLNKDNQITVGHEKKRLFKAQLTSYVMDGKSGNPWSKNEVQVLEGLRNYYRMIEKETIDGIVERLSKKFDVDIVHKIKQDLSA